MYKMGITLTHNIPNLWIEAAQKINKDVPPIKQKIENEFRQMLGLEI